MKNLFISVVVTGIFTIVSAGTQAQPNVNIERLDQRAHNQTSLKFIDGIELTPSASTVSGEAVNDEITVIKLGKPVEKKNTNTTTASSIEKCESWQFKYAMMMNIEVETITNSKLYSFIDDWWGTRYRFGGSTKAGIDCSAFSGALLGNVYNVTLPRTARDQYNVVDKIDRENLAEGDLVFFNTRGGVSHVGVYLGNDYFVHSSVHDGVTISSLNDDYYSRKFIGGGRVPNAVVTPTANVEEEK